MTKAVDDTSVGSLTNMCKYVITEGYTSMHAHWKSIIIVPPFKGNTLPQMWFVQSHQAPGTIAEYYGYNVGDGNKIYNAVR